MARDYADPGSSMPTGPLPPRPRPRLPPVDPRLSAAVRDPGIRSLATGVVQHALEALADLQRLDESLYERFMEGAGRVTEDAAPEALLKRLSTVTFRGLRSLLNFTARIRPKLEAAPGPASDAGDDFDFGDLEGAPPGGLPTTDEPGFDLGDADIGDLLDVIDEHEQRGEGERWNELADKIAAYDYGLRTQLTELDDRLATSLSSGHVPQAIEALDDTRSAASEGIFAMLSSVYATFAPEVDPDTLAPGHLTSLGRALLVRGGLTDLTRTVAPLNEVVQRADAALPKRQAAYAEIARTLGEFIRGEVFRAMRPADRWELDKFERELRAGTGPAAALTAEGLAKYLESLGSINRREVLVAHDARALEELREALSAARTLLEINTRVAAELVGKAYAAAVSLYGRNPVNDDLIVALRDARPTLASAAEIEATLGTLELLLADDRG